MVSSSAHAAASLLSRSWLEIDSPTIQSIGSSNLEDAQVTEIDRLRALAYALLIGFPSGFIAALYFVRWVRCKECCQKYDKASNSDKL